VSLATNFYLYLVWLLVYLVVTIALGNGPGIPEPVRPGWDVVRQVVAPDSTLWFIYALVIFVAGLALVRRWPPWLVLFGLFVVGWAAHREFTYLDPAWSRIPQLAVFFGVGVYAKDKLRRLAASPWHSAAAALLSVGLYALLITNPPIIYYPVYVACSVLAGVAMLGLARLISKHAPGPARVGEWVGRRTLGIYVLHFPFVMMLAVMSSGPFVELERSLLSSMALRWYFPLMATAVIVLACLALEEGLRRVGAGWMFRLPTRAARTSGRPDDAPSDTVLGPKATRDG
jgi:peptidoglycan/LPS O-acetylase OafA/YrhL